MFVTNHVLSGVLIGRPLKKRPGTALLAGVASHLVLDAIPHWGCQSCGPEGEQQFLTWPNGTACSGWRRWLPAALAVERSGPGRHGGRYGRRRPLGSRQALPLLLRGSIRSPSSCSGCIAGCKTSHRVECPTSCASASPLPRPMFSRSCGPVALDEECRASGAGWPTQLGRCSDALAMSSPARSTPADTYGAALSSAARAAPAALSLAWRTYGVANVTPDLAASDTARLA